jgi:hypothetical protein
VSIDALKLTNKKWYSSVGCLGCHMSLTCLHASKQPPESTMPMHLPHIQSPCAHICHAPMHAYHEAPSLIPFTDACLLCVGYSAGSGQQAGGVWDGCTVPSCWCRCHSQPPGAAIGQPPSHNQRSVLTAVQQPRQTQNAPCDLRLTGPSYSWSLKMSNKKATITCHVKSLEACELLCTVCVILVTNSRSDLSWA